MIKRFKIKLEKHVTALIMVFRLHHLFVQSWTSSPKILKVMSKTPANLGEIKIHTDNSRGAGWFITRSTSGQKSNSSKWEQTGSERHRQRRIQQKKVDPSVDHKAVITSCSRQCVRSGALQQLQFLCMFRVVKIVRRPVLHNRNHFLDLPHCRLLFSHCHYVETLSAYPVPVARSRVIHRTSTWYNKLTLWPISKKVRFSKYLLRKIHFSEFFFTESKFLLR